ncbi:MAG TPA: MFS transporter [Tepidisphaeraceae bacterium]|jgi:DHA1 family tetracycline resistance protein-like MFS transporter
MTEPSIAADETVVGPPKGALFAIFLIVLADLLGFGVIIPLLPSYARTLHASDFQVGLLFSVYSICQLIAAPILGLVSDRYGRRPVLIASQIGSVIGFILLGYATHPGLVAPGVGLILVYISRTIDGFSGGNISTAQAYIADVTTPQTRSRGMGMLGAAFGIGFSIGPALGGLLGHYKLSYPAFAAAAFSLLAALLTYFRLPESRFHKPAEAEVWLHPSRFLPIIRNSPLIQMQLIFFFSMMAFVMMETCIAMFLADRFNYGVRTIGLFFALAGFIIIIVQGGLIGRLTKRFGEWPLVITGPLLVSIAMLLYVQAGFVPLVIFIVVSTILNAGGRSLQQPSISSLISQHSDPDQQGAVFGLFHMLGSLARAIGPMIAAAIYTTHHTGPFALAGFITLAVTAWTVLLRAQVKQKTPHGAAFDQAEVQTRAT